MRLFRDRMAGACVYFRIGWPEHASIAEEGAKFWLGVMNELKARGVRDVLVVVVDGLKGFPEAIEAAFPEATVQTCVVHLIRYSLAHASWRERKELAGALRPIYQADTLEEAEEALDGFEAGSWGRKFPAIVRSWRRNWTQVIPFFAFSKPIRRVIYTTNAIESLNSTVRRAVRTPVAAGSPAPAPAEAIPPGLGKRWRVSHSSHRLTSNPVIQSREAKTNAVSKVSVLHTEFLTVLSSTL